jgi:hypothetical protein
MTTCKSLVVSSIACIIAASSACASAATAAAATSGSCDKPASSAQESVVATPDYMSESEIAADPQQTAAQTAWDDYQTAVFEGLSKSPDPRDWALATLTEALQFDAKKSNRTTQDQQVARLQRASRAAPDDMLVQWIATRSQRDDSNAEALRLLKRAEPDNAAVWLLDVDSAMRHKDQAATDVALQKMSASTRFDLHYAELIEALAQAYQRYPQPEYQPGSADSSASDQSREPSKEAIPLIAAFSVAAATAFPSFQAVLNACRVNQASRENVSRAGDCAAIGRLMAAHSDNFLSNRIGSALLRASRTFNQDDIQVARDQGWIYDQYASIISDGDSPAAAARTVGFLHDWVETGAELEAMRRAVAQADRPASPPQDWADAQSPFSAERLRAEDVRLAKESGTH